ncbi:hypothetical protein D3C76_975710 [compost metagenome]
MPQAQLQRGPGLAENVPVQAHLRRGGRRPGNAAAGQVAEHGNADDRRGHHRRVMRRRHHDPGANGTGQDRQEGAHFHQAVAAYQFIFPQGLRQDRVLHRPEQRRMGAHGEQRQQHQRQVIEHEADGADRHDGDFPKLDQADQRVLGELFPELPGQGREQEKRQDKQQRTQVDPDRAVTFDGQLVQNGEDQRLFEHVVVERPEGLGDEERQEAPGAQQGEL